MAATLSWEHVGLRAFRHQLPPSCPSHFPLPLLPRAGDQLWPPQAAGPVSGPSRVGMASREL